MNPIDQIKDKTPEFNSELFQDIMPNEPLGKPFNNNVKVNTLIKRLNADRIKLVAYIEHQNIDIELDVNDVQKYLGLNVNQNVIADNLIQRITVDTSQYKDGVYTVEDTALFSALSKRLAESSAQTIIKYREQLDTPVEQIELSDGKRNVQVIAKTTYSHSVQKYRLDEIDTESVDVQTVMYSLPGNDTQYIDCIAKINHKDLKIKLKTALINIDARNTPIDMQLIIDRHTAIQSIGGTNNPTISATDLYRMDQIKQYFEVGIRATLAKIMH